MIIENRKLKGYNYILGTREGGRLRWQLLLMLLMLMLLSATVTMGQESQEPQNQEPQTERLIKIGGSVYGGARQANVGGSTSV